MGSPEPELLEVPAQGSLDARGRLLHEDDPAAQLALSLANLAGALEEAARSWTDVARLRVYTTDLDALREVFDVLTEHLGSLGATPPTTVVEVPRLPVPGMTVSIDALAVGCTATPTREEPPA